MLNVACFVQSCLTDADFVIFSNYCLIGTRLSVPIYVWVRPDELEVIRERMAEVGIRNMSAYIRKMALGGYVLHVDLEPVKELVSLQRRCANNLNQAAIHANSYGGLYPDELKRLQKDYADLWEPLSDLLAQLSAIVTM